ncbi:reverse transcriptase domain-containing protein, partial [Tanacetum coccineum]
MAEDSQKWHNRTSRGRSTETSDQLAVIQAQLNNLGREIKKVNEKVYVAQVGCEQCKGPHYTTDCLQKEEGKALEEAYYMQFSGPFQGRGYRETAPGCYHKEPMSIDQNFRNTNRANEQVELADKTVKYPKGIAANVLVGIGKFTFPIDFIILDMLEDVKVPLILGRPFLSTARAKIDVYKRKITLRVKEENIIFKSVKPASSIIKRLRRNQGDDLMPTIEEGKVIEEFRTRDEDLDTGIDDYPSYCNDDKKIHIDRAHNLKFSCMIGFEFTHANFFLLLYVSVMSRKFHNLIMKNKMVYKGNNVVGALVNVPIFIGKFSVMTDFAVLEDMDAYRDNEMGNIIFGEPFLKEVGIKIKWFEGISTLYNGDNEVTYQMVPSHPKFKHHTNEQCNKIPPLLK